MVTVNAPGVSAVMLIGLFSFALAGCASPPKSAPPSKPAANVAERAADEAARMVGKPYRYGGADPAGFDCSGLVQYSYRQAGRAVPRSTQDQRRASRLIARSELRPGDLLFFDQEGKKNSHVAIYLGGGEIVHAPSSGKRVRRDRMDTPYWKRHLSEIRRLV
jgi:cell wall-associated NlpC family hydrolase